ncbi:MAG: LysM domain-containing protein [Acidobacteriota bacterium]
MADLTIQQLHDNVAQQAALGGAVVLSAANMPSPALWNKAAIALGVTELDITPPINGSVIVGPVTGNSFTITGHIAVLGFSPQLRVVTATVIGGDPNFSFVIGLAGSTGWTFGDWLPMLDTTPFARLVQSSVLFTWSSANDMTATASPLSFAATVALSGPFGYLQQLTGTATLAWSAPILFDAAWGNQPKFDLRAPFTATPNFTIDGFIDVATPYLQAVVTFPPDEDDPARLVLTTAVDFGMIFQPGSGDDLEPFTLTVPVFDDSSVLYLQGQYGDPGQVLTLVDVFTWLLDLDPPPTFPEPLEGFFNKVGLDSFVATFGSVFSSGNFGDMTSIEVRVDSRDSGGGDPVWDLYDNEITVQRLYMTASLGFITDDYTSQSYLFGAELRFFALLFRLELLVVDSDDISFHAELTTPTGLPLRFNDLLRKLNSSLDDVNLEDFFELTFSVIGLDLTYNSTSTEYGGSIYTVADFSLRLFGKELLGLHDLYLQFDASGNSNAGTFQYDAVLAGGTMAILGFNLPATLVLSAEQKTFDIGPFSFTLGDIIKFLVQLVHPSWDFELPAPWNVLDSIGFTNLHLTFDLIEDTITLDTGVSADLGFISLTHLSLTYYQKTPKAKKEGVVLSLQGTFLGLPITTDEADDEGLSWDVINDMPPEVPGGGEQIFKLDYLGLGQHVSFRDPGPLETIGQVMTALETNLRPTEDDANPLAGAGGLVFDQNSGWLIGAKFTVVETVTISAIFNDPQLYGIRIAVDGPRAASFQGLEFEILYKKVTDTIGLYHIELKLPDVMRHLEFGEVSITLPIVVIDIYTNGNFRLDFGFPYNANFERSFAIQVFPFVGFGGFYIALLEGATSKTVPRVTNGEFSPVVEFGFGLSVGVGKTIHEGVLSGGLTVTVEGILEGALAWFNPTDVEREKAVYWSILGTVAIVGDLFGEIDFAIIKASVEVKAWARATLLIESYQPIHISIDVGVEAHVKVKILFITIHLSFEFTLHAEFTIGSAQPAPWVLADPQTTQLARRKLLRQRTRRNLRPRTRRPSIARMLREPLPDFATADSRRAAALDDDDPIVLTFFPAFTQSSSTSIVGSNGPSAPFKVQSVPILVLQNTIPPAATTHREVVAADDNDPTAPFNRLVASMLTRVIDARVAARGGDQTVVTAFDLAVIYTQLLAGLADPAFSYDALSAYFGANLPFRIAIGATGAPPASATIFPMPPAITMTSSDGVVSVNYDTDPRLMVDGAYIAAIDAYFRSFDVKRQTGVAASADEANIPPRMRRARQAAGAAETMTSFVFRDYFLLMTRGAVQASIDFLQNYLYTTANNLSLDAIAASLAATIPQPELTDPTAFSIALANQHDATILNPAVKPSLSGVLYQTRTTDTLQSMATLFGVTPLQLLDAADNAGARMLVINASVALGDLVYIVADDLQSIESVSMKFGIAMQALMDANPGIDSAPLAVGQHVNVPAANAVVGLTDTFATLVETNGPWGLTMAQLAASCAGQAGILQPLSVWSIPAFGVTINAGDTLQSIAARYNLELADLIADGFGATSALLLDGHVLLVPNRPEMPIDALVTAIVSGAAVNDLAGTVSRFLMQGLRLPSGATSPPDFTNMQPLYNLTGQQFDAPAGGVTSYSLTMTSAESWLTFASGASYAYSAADFQTIAAFATSFTPDFQPPTPIPLMAYAPNRYSLGQSIHWQTPDGTVVVTPSANTNAAGEPLLWPFPDTLLQRLANAAAGTTGTSEPQFTLTIGVQSDPNAPIVTTPVDLFAWATVVDLTVQLVRQPDNTIINVNNDYQMFGADQDGRGTLQALWSYMNAVADPAAIYLLFAADPADPNGDGLVSASVDPLATLVLKTNLSTVSTNEPQAVGRAGDVEIYSASIADPKNFVKLLWECSTVRTGGYYLNYTQTQEALGIPSNIFDESGLAALKMLIVFESQKHTAGASQPEMLTFNNTALLAQNLDTSVSNLYVEAASFRVPPGSTLQSLATAMGFATAPDFATVNQDIKLLLRTGATMASGGNPHTIAVGDTLRRVAALIAGGSLSTLVEDNLTTAGLLTPDALVQYAQDQLRLQSTAPAGSVGFVLVRSNPDPADLPLGDMTPQQQLGVLFNLLGEDIQANTWFAPPAGTAGQGLPSGPTQSTAATPDPLQWIYRNTLQASELALPAYNYAPSLTGLPAALHNPYAGLAVGSNVALQLQFQDLYGNRTAFASPSTPVVTLPFGYTDALFACTAWPAVAFSYEVMAATAPQFSLVVDYAFDLANYVSGQGRSLTQTSTSIATDLEKIRQIYYQFVQPDVQLRLTTTLSQPSKSAPPTSYFPWRAALFDPLDAIHLFVTGIESMKDVVLQPAAGDTLTALATPYLVDAAALLENNSSLVAAALFDLSTTTTLTYPVSEITRSGDSLQVLAQRSGVVGVVTLATNNAGQPLPPGRVMSAPQRTIPTLPDTTGDRSLQQLGDAYAASPLGLAVWNAAAAGILRAGTPVSLQGLTIAIAAGDTFQSLVTRFMQYTVAAPASLESIAEQYGIGAVQLALANETAAGIWAGTFVYLGHSEQAAATDDLYDIALRFDAAGYPVTVSTLAEANKNVTTLFAANAVLTTGVYDVAVSDVAWANVNVTSIFDAGAQLVTSDLVVKAGNTLASVSSAYGFAVDDLATRNAALPDFFISGTPLFIETRTYVPPSGLSMAEVVSTLQTTYAALGTYNGTHPLLAQTRPNVQVPARLVMPPTPPLLPYRVTSSDTLSTIAAKLGGSATALSVADANWTLPYALTPGATVTFGGNTLTILETDTFATLQSRFGAIGTEPTPQQLVTALDVAGALRAGGTLLIAAPTAGSQTTPSTLASQFGVDPIAFLRTNKSTAALLAAGVSVTVRTVTRSTRANETINTLLTDFQQSDATVTLDELLAALATTACLSPAGSFLLPPAAGSFTQSAASAFPDLIFSVDVTLSVERLDFELTQSVLTALAAAGVPQSSITALQPMAGTLYTSGDAFRADLRTSLGSAFATFPLDLVLQLSALPSAFVDPMMSGVANVLRAVSFVPPRLIDNGDGLTSFATAFEAAFGGAVKLGVGAQPKSRTDNARKLWGVQFGPNGYSYSITPAASSFALQPLSTSLINQAGVRMQLYVPGSGLEPVTPVDLDAIELDTWAGQFAAAVDLFLSAPYAVPANQRLAAQVATVVACKARLAGLIANGVANLLQTPASPGDLAAAQEAFEQRLKIRLSSAYGSETILQYPVSVTSGNSSDPETAPRLSGKASSVAFVTGPVETIASIAAVFDVSQEFLLDAIGTMTGILNDGVNGAPPAQVKYTPAPQTVTLTQGETLAQLAAAFGVPLDGLIGTLVVVSGNTLFAPRTSINVTSVSVVIGSTGNPGVTVPPNSFDDIAYYFDLPVSFTAVAVQDVPAIFAASVTSLSYDGKSTPVTSGDTLRSVAARLETTAAPLAELYRGTAQLLRAGTKVSSLSVLPQYGLTTSKIALSKPSSQLTFFVDVESPSLARKLFMNLDYAVNEMEFDIAPVTGIDDYQASSWLTFVLPFTSSQPNIGPVEVPIVLRGYPTSPLLLSQEGIPAPVPGVVPGTNPPLTTLKSWEYEYSFEYLVAAQDEIYTAVALTDVSDAPPTRLAEDDPPPLTLFEALAQFALNWSAVQNDLDLLPAMKPDSESDTTDSAIVAFATLVQQVTDAWAAGNVLGAAFEAMTEVHEYLITFRTQPEAARDLATMIFLGLTPAETFWPDQVWIFQDGVWVALTRETIQPGANEVVFDFPSGIPITSSTRYRIAYTALDVIRYQSARSSVRIERNRHLISESPTAPSFSYATPDVSFANPFTPLLERDEPYEISGPSLADALSTFFQDLFNPAAPMWTSASTRDLTITCGYRFALTPPLTATTPILHHTRYPFTIRSDYQTTPGTFTSDLASAVTTWQSENLPPGTPGTLVFDVVVYETKDTDDTRPVLELRDVQFVI